MSRKIMVGGEEKGDWFDAVISWAAKPEKAKPPAPVPPATPSSPAPPSKRLPKEKVGKAARAIKTREQLMPTSGPSEPHTVIAPEDVVDPEEVVEPAGSRSKRTLEVLHPCGHFSWASPEADEAARAEGKCCGNWRHLSKWDVRGLYSPVPESQRRSPEKQRIEWGWPGLCCDPKTGLYIGGIGNDCRYYHNGNERCVVHAPVSKHSEATAPAVDLAEPNEPNEEANFMDALTPTPLPTTGKVKSAGGKKRSQGG